MRVAEIKTSIPELSNIDEALANNHPIVFVDYNPTGLTDPVMGESTQQAGENDLATALLTTDYYSKGLIDGFVFAPVNKLSLKMVVQVSRVTRLGSRTI